MINIMSSIVGVMSLSKFSIRPAISTISSPRYMKEYNMSLGMSFLPMKI